MERKMVELFNLSEDQCYEGEEKREFLRLPYEHPLKYHVCRKGLLKELQIGTTKNVSQNGLLFKAKNPPVISSIVLLETDLKTLANCIEVEDALVELNGRIMGKVVRVIPEEGGTSLYEIGVQFIRVGDDSDKHVTKAMKVAAKLS